MIENQIITRHDLEILLRNLSVAPFFKNCQFCGEEFRRLELEDAEF